MKKIVVSISKQNKDKVLNSVDLNHIISNVYGEDLPYEIELHKSRSETIILQNGKVKTIVGLSSSSEIARNAFVSQPFIALLKNHSNIINLDFSNVYLYVRISAKPTDRTIHDIRCLKSRGVKFIGIDKLENNKGKIIHISDLKPFENHQDYSLSYYSLKETSGKKGNDVTKVDFYDNSIEILFGKTDGANYGSFLMHILYCSTIDKKLSVYTIDNAKRGKTGEHHLHPKMLEFYSKFKIKIKPTSEDLYKALRSTKTLESSDIIGRTSQNQAKFKKNLIERTGTNSICELTDVPFLLSSSTFVASHILPCSSLKKLQEIGKISIEEFFNGIESANNGLYLCGFFDDLFDGKGKPKLTFDSDGTPIFKDGAEKAKELITKNPNMSNQMKVFMKLHNSYIFSGKSISEITNEDLEELKTVLNNS
jgi:hypothetical protein